MDTKTKKIIRKEIVTLLKDKSVLTLHGDQGVIKVLCRKHNLNESTEAVTIANLYRSTKGYEAEVIDPRFPDELRSSPKFINDLNKTWKDKVVSFFILNGVIFIGLAVVVIGIFLDYKLSGYSPTFFKDKGLIIAGVIISVLGLLKR